MATAEKGSLLKNVKIKIKDKDDKTNSKEQNKFNVSGEDQKEKDKDKNSSKFSQEDKDIPNNKLNLSEAEGEGEEAKGEGEGEEQGKEEKKSNSKIINENSEEANNVQNNLKEEEEEEKSENENSENKSDYNYKNTNEREDGNNPNAHEGGMRGSGHSDKNNSSFLDSNHYNNLQNMDENEDLNDSIDECYIDRSKPFLTNGKFMQIQPHFQIFSKQINDLHNGLYENTKKCLIYKCSLQQSENLIREKANTVVKDLVDKIFNLRQLFNNANKSISMTINEVNQSVNKVKQIQAKTRKEINECDRRANDCEGQIGYKLLGKPNYSFMKRLYSTTAK